MKKLIIFLFVLSGCVPAVVLRSNNSLLKMGSLKLPNLRICIGHPDLWRVLKQKRPSAPS